jgi:hypothetical protein
MLNDIKQLYSGTEASEAIINWIDDEINIINTL